MTTTKRTSPEKARARFALCKVESVHGQRDKFLTQLRKLPARLHANGLGQTAAFLLAQGQDKPEREVYTWLADWLCERGCYPNRQLIQSIVGQGSAADPASQARVEQQYRRASTEARALSTWLKRFAEAFLRDSEPTIAEPPGDQP